MNNYQKLSLQLHRFFVVLFILLLTTQGTLAQQPLTAEVDRTSLTTDDLVTLTVVVRSSALTTPRPTLPPLDGFDVVGSSSSSQINVINGEMSAEASYHYRLHPTQPGELTIGAISVELDGQVYTTDPITIQVSQGSAQPTPPNPNSGPAAPAPDTLSGQNFFVEAEVDNPTPTIGQQIIYTFRFYQAVNLFDQPRYDAPTFTGFWNQQQPDQSQYTIEVSGRAYRVTELRTLLFPTIAGETTIEPAVLTIPGDLFTAGVTIQTQPVTVDVQSPPPNAPADFNGAVGQFEIAAQVDATQVKVNDPLTLRITLDGVGNIENLPEPVWPTIPDWRAFESQATTNTRFQDGVLSGNRVYERLMVPGVAGEFTIPPISYTYFDPATGEYKTIATEAFPVTVTPGEESPPVPVVLGAGKEAIERIGGDIRHIKPVPPKLNSDSGTVTARAWYWILWGIPLLLMAGNYIRLNRQARLQGNTALARSLQARKRALKTLALAKKENRDPYDSAGQILTAYLGDKLNRSVSGLTRPELAAHLQSAGVQAELIQRVQNSLSLSDLGRYSPATANPAHAQRLPDDLKKLIDDLEAAF